MVISERVGRSPNTESAEILTGEQNSFARFIDENRGLFEKNSSLTYELRDEEQGWKNSPTLDSIAKMNVDLALLLYPQLNNITGKQMRKLKDQVKTNATNFALGTSNENKLIAQYFPGFLSTKPLYTPKSQILNETLGESLNDFRTSFHDARAPLVSGIRESKAELMSQLENFILSNPSNLFAFEDFLSDKKNHRADREAIRPFLASLAETEHILVRDNKEGVLHRAVKKWVAELKEKPTSGIIAEFTASIKSPNVLEWLEFAAQGEDIANFLNSRPDVSTWTTELREALSSFVTSRYLGALSSIEKALEQYRRPLTLKSISQRLNPKLEAEIEEVTVRIPGKRSQDNNKRVSEKDEKEKYPVGILKRGTRSWLEVRVLAEEELTRRLQKEADSLDPADQRMIADLEKTFLSLREDPYGLGTKKLKDRSVIVGNQRLPLRSLNPRTRRRIGLSLDHPESREIRIVYVIYKNNGVPAIGLEGVYRHEDYVKKFGS